MTALLHYKVTQVREIEVTATSAAEAGLIATAALDGANPVEGVSGRATEPKEMSLKVDRN